MHTGWCVESLTHTADEEEHYKSLFRVTCKLTITDSSCCSISKPHFKTQEGYMLVTYRMCTEHVLAMLKKDCEQGKRQHGSAERRKDREIDVCSSICKISKRFSRFNCFSLNKLNPLDCFYNQSMLCFSSPLCLFLQLEQHSEHTI